MTLDDERRPVQLFGCGDFTCGANGSSASTTSTSFGKSSPIDGRGRPARLRLVCPRRLRGDVVALLFLDDSRIGRAWRSLREDPLAAELMGMPGNRLS